jgi:hypothetical protein
MQRLTADFEALTEQAGTLSRQAVAVVASATQSTSGPRPSSSRSVASHEEPQVDAAA